MTSRDLCLVGRRPEDSLWPPGGHHFSVGSLGVDDSMTLGLKDCSFSEEDLLLTTYSYQEQAPEASQPIFKITPVAPLVSSTSKPHTTKCYHLQNP